MNNSGLRIKYNNCPLKKYWNKWREKNLSESNSYQPTTKSLLLPTDINSILDDLSYLLKPYPNLWEKESLFTNYKHTTKRFEVLFPLQSE